MLKILKERVLSKKERKRKRKHGCNGDEEVRKKKNCKEDKGKHIYDRSTDCWGGKDKKTRRKHKNPGIENRTLSDKCKLGGTFGIEKSSTFPPQVMITNTPHKRNSKCNNYQGVCLTRKGEIDPDKNLEIFKGTFAESDMLETKLEWSQTVQTDFEDEKWWLPKKISEKTQAKDDSNGTMIINQGIQPYARYLADADIYALPYVVPF